MPDTGAPWNIPYVAGTDLVADWPTDSQTLAQAIADGLDDAGYVKQVVSTFKDDAFTTTSTSFTDLTGLSLSITPTDNTSRVIVVASVSTALLPGGIALNVVRDSTALFQPSGGANLATLWTVIGSGTGQVQPTYVGIDSPATISATTYKLQIRTTSGTAYVNRWSTNSAFTSTSNITAIEVKA